MPFVLVDNLEDPYGGAAAPKTAAYITDVGTYTGAVITDNVSLPAALQEVEIFIEAEATEQDAHIARTDNPHSVTKAQVGLGSVDDTSDTDKPVSTAQQAALDLKVTEGGNANLVDLDVTGTHTSIDQDLSDPEAVPNIGQLDERYEALDKGGKLVVFDCHYNDVDLATRAFKNPNHFVYVTSSGGTPTWARSLESNEISEGHLKITVPDNGASIGYELMQFDYRGASYTAEASYELFNFSVARFKVSNLNHQTMLYRSLNRGYHAIGFDPAQNATNIFVRIYNSSNAGVLLDTGVAMPVDQFVIVGIRMADSRAATEWFVKSETGVLLGSGTFGHFTAYYLNRDATKFICYNLANEASECVVTLDYVAYTRDASQRGDKLFSI